MTLIDRLLARCAEQSAARGAAATAPLLAGLALLAACGAGGDATTAGVAAVPVSCDAIKQMDAYRYSVALKIASPQPPVPSGQTATPAPLSALTGALRALFSDFTLDGAFVAPDRSQAILRFHEEDLELRRIGAKSWLRVGSTWQEDASPDIGLMTPLVVCRDIVTRMSASLGVDEPEREQVSGVDTDHYRLDEEQLRELPEVLGEQTPERYLVDVWLARDGSWPVQLKIVSSDVNEKGESIGFSITMVIRDVGDRGIRIDPPVTGDDG